jgi:hypothetical protein
LDISYAMFTSIILMNSLVLGCRKSDRLRVARNTALLAVQIFLPLAVAVVLAASVSIARLLADLDAVLTDDARVRDTSHDVLGRRNVLEVLGADFGSSLLERRSRAYMAAIALDLALFTAPVVHLVVAVAGGVASALGRAVLSTRVDGVLASNARITRRWCYSDRAGGRLIVLLDKLFGEDLGALLLVAVEVELAVFAVLVVPLLPALTSRGAEPAWRAAIIFASVDSELASNARVTRRWCYSDRAGGWLIVLLDEIFRAGIEACPAEFTLASRAVSRDLDALWFAMLATVPFLESERLTIDTAAAIRVLEEPTVAYDLAEPTLISITSGHTLVPGNLAVFIAAVVSCPRDDRGRSRDGNNDIVSLSLLVAALRRLYASCSHWLGQSYSNKESDLPACLQKRSGL